MSIWSELIALGINKIRITFLITIYWIKVPINWRGNMMKNMRMMILMTMTLIKTYRWVRNFMIIKLRMRIMMTIFKTLEIKIWNTRMRKLIAVMEKTELGLKKLNRVDWNACNLHRRNKIINLPQVVIMLNT